MLIGSLLGPGAVHAASLTLLRDDRRGSDGDIEYDTGPSGGLGRPKPHDQDRITP